MLARRVGLTKTYNLFHDPACREADIVELRRLHVEMDTAVRDAYGWQDLMLGHDFHGDGKETRFTLAPAAKQEVLRRLLKLNLERAAEEAAEAAAAKPVKKAKKGRGAEAGQTTTDEMMIEPIVAEKEAGQPKLVPIRDEDIEPSILTWLVSRERAPDMVRQYRLKPIAEKVYKPILRSLHSVRLAKEEYGLQETLGIPVGASFEKKNWGPLSTTFQKAVERAIHLGWLVKTKDAEGRTDMYDLGPNAADGVRAAFQIIGDHDQQAEEMLFYLDGDRTVEAERQMTVHKVWADLKAEGLTATTEAVVKGVQEWKPDRTGFTRQEILVTLQDLKNRKLLRTFPRPNRLPTEQT